MPPIETDAPPETGLPLVRSEEHLARKGDGGGGEPVGLLNPSPRWGAQARRVVECRFNMSHIYSITCPLEPYLIRARPRENRGAAARPRPVYHNKPERRLYL